MHHSCAHCVSTLVSVWESRGLCRRAGFTQTCAVSAQDGRYLLALRARIPTSDTSGRYQSTVDHQDELAHGALDSEIREKE